METFERNTTTFTVGASMEIFQKEFQDMLTAHCEKVERAMIRFIGYHNLTMREAIDRLRVRHVEGYTGDGYSVSTAFWLAPPIKEAKT